MAYEDYEGPFDYARKRPAQLVAGLFVGALSTVLTFGYAWPIAPIFPLLICACTMASQGVKAFSVGAFAAFLGAFAFVALFAILYLL